MQAIRYLVAGAPEVLKYETIERPEPRYDEVLVEVDADAVNPVDAKRRAGRDPPSPKTTGSDLAGVVVEVGEESEDYAPGYRVFATGLHTERFTGGSFADYAVIPTDLLATLPDPISSEEGAAVALVGITAWRAFVDHAELEPGAEVFILGGNGGVGHVAVGLADTMGGSATCTARPKYHDALRDLGATEVFDNERDDLADAVHRWSGGADIVLDHMPERYITDDVEVSAFGDDIVVIFCGSASLPEKSPARSKELDVHMMSMSNLVRCSNLPDISPILERLADLMVADRLDVLIDRTYILEEGAEAHHAVMEESVLGKIVVVP